MAQVITLCLPVHLQVIYHNFSKSCYSLASNVANV